LTTVSYVIVQELVAWGVKLVLAIPGTSSLGIIDTVRREPSIRFIVVRHEENAAMIASAYNKLTGRIAACVTIAGPGATNLSTELYDTRRRTRLPFSRSTGRWRSSMPVPGGSRKSIRMPSSGR
jgi:pyruvate oxidase